MTWPTRTVIFLLLTSLLFTQLAPKAQSGHQVLTNPTRAYGVLSAGQRVIDPSVLRAELIVRNGLRLWFSVRGNPSARLATAPGAGLVSESRLLPPNGEVRFHGTFPNPGDTLTLTFTLNTPEAAILNVVSVLFAGIVAAVPSATQIDPQSLVSFLQDLRDIVAIQQAATAFIPPPQTRNEWTRATGRAVDILLELPRDSRQLVLLSRVLSRIGLNVATSDLRRVFTPLRLRGLFQHIVDNGIFMYVTRGHEPSVTYERSSTAPHGPTPGVQTGNWLPVVPPPDEGRRYTIGTGRARILIDTIDLEFIRAGLNGRQPDVSLVDAWAFLARRHRTLTLKLISGYHTPEFARRSCECSHCPVPNVSAHYKAQAMDIFEVDGVWINWQADSDPVRQAQARQVVRTLVRDLVTDLPSASRIREPPTQVIVYSSHDVQALAPEITAAYGPEGSRGNMGVFAVSTSCYANHVHVGW